MNEKCVRCGSSDLEHGTKTLCLKCKMDYREYNRISHEKNYQNRRDEKNRKSRERYQEAKALGLCTRCHKQKPEPNKTLCKKCSSRLNVQNYMRNDGNRISDLGGCPWCGKPSVKGYKSCATCLPKRQAAMLSARRYLSNSHDGWQRLNFGRSAGSISK